MRKWSFCYLYECCNLRNRKHQSEEEVTGIPATDMNEEELRRHFNSFGVPEKVAETLLEENEPYLLIAVIEWLMMLPPGFNDVRVIKGIACIVKNRSHAVNASYLENTPAIPQLPSTIIVMEKIVEFFTLTRIILECECGLYKPDLPSDQKALPM